MCENFNFVLLFLHAQIKNRMAHMNNLHTKQILYCQRFYFPGLELQVN